MIWPFRRRPQKVIVVHRIERLDDILKALNPPEPVYEPPPPPKPDPDREEFVEWLDAQAFESVKRGDFVGMWEINAGRRPGSPAQRERALRILTAAGAPMAQPKL